MNYTQNHHFPQWVQSDRIMMEDFNQMCADMEAGLNNAQAYAADIAARIQADGSANTAKAQETADKALAIANNAYCPEKKPFAAGTYVGNGSSLAVNVGFRPSFVIVAGANQTNNYGVAGIAMIGDKAETFSPLTITNTGFTVKTVFEPAPLGGGSQETHPYVNSNGRTFGYIAFR